jgi:predicted alpha-1,6-mannanase (GH76 family)
VRVNGNKPRVLGATRALLRSYSARTGRWRTPTGEAWQPALALEAVLLAYEVTGDGSFLSVVERSFNRYRGRRSRFHDDDGWYLNAWLRAYDVTGEPRYLAEAQALFEAMTAAWDDTCGGGLWWSTDRTYKNAITNELFLLAAARLSRRTASATALDWALRTWRWFEGSGMINSDGLVNDGLDGQCRNNGQPTWTYNQGVILGALVELWRATEDRSYLDHAERIATAATRELVHSGSQVLREAVAGEENRDAHVFKGILAQGLARLHAADPDAYAAIGTFLRANAEAVAGAGTYGYTWHGTPGTVNAATQASAALLLGAVDLLDG